MSICPFTKNSLTRTSSDYFLVPQRGERGHRAQSDHLRRIGSDGLVTQKISPAYCYFHELMI